jgi:hypothetical protein
MVHDDPVSAGDAHASQRLPRVQIGQEDCCLIQKESVNIPVTLEDVHHLKRLPK